MNDIKKLLVPDTDLSLDLNLDLSFENNPEEIKTNAEIKKIEVGESLQAIRKAEKEFYEKLNLETDTNFYFSVVFKSPQELEEFKKKYGIELHYNDFIFAEDLLKALKLE